jgi:hypothetical protein
MKALILASALMLGGAAVAQTTSGSHSGMNHGNTGSTMGSDQSTTARQPGNNRNNTGRTQRNSQSSGQGSTMGQGSMQGTGQGTMSGGRHVGTSGDTGTMSGGSMSGTGGSGSMSGGSMSALDEQRWRHRHERNGRPHRGRQLPGLLAHCHRQLPPDERAGHAPPFAPIRLPGGRASARPP